MKLSTKGRYGLMAMYQLAAHYGEGPISLNSIAEMEGLSEAYLEQLFSLLKKNNLIKSVRGAQGGYLLTKSPNDIKIREIIQALEGEMMLSCCHEPRETPCQKESYCATKEILEKIQIQMEGILDSMTLADM
ncbi:MAG: Rrf2 family transcriptional regulator [Tissierellia bacterium]|nr:Rrf2 family transcriptional regulator [Tissierellia bacterium]